MTSPGHLVVILIAALAVVVAGVRRRAGRSGRPRRRPPALGWTDRLGDTGLVAAREIKERARGRLFRFGTLAVLVVVALSIVLSTKTGAAKRPVIAVGMVDVPARIVPVIAESAKVDGASLRLTSLRSIASADAALRSGRADLVVDGADHLVTDQRSTASNSSATSTLARTLSSALGELAAFRAAGLTPAQGRIMAASRAAPITNLAKATSTSAEAVSLIGLPLLFFMFIQYNTWTLLGVMEEKSTRVVEVLLATVRPRSLLAGKVLGIGVLALAQAGLIVAVALGVAKATGSSLARGSTPSYLGAVFVWLVVGYAFYAWVYAAAGSMAERRDQVQAIAMPLSVPIAAGYVVGLIALASDSASLLVKVLAYLPPTAPFAMSALVGIGAASWWQFLLAVLLSVAATVGVARLAAAVYRRAILRTGRRVGLREVLGRSARHA